ncbi:MAG: hypothetical protein ACREUU_13080 [Gammaproteobacteria bacterium]
MNDLDKILAELQRTEPYVEDRGFTATVMAQIPAHRSLPLWEKNFIMLLATGLGSIVAAWQIPLGKLLAAVLSMEINILTVATAALAVYLFTYGILWINRRELA